MRTVRLPGVEPGLSAVVQGATTLLNLDDAEALDCLDAAFEAGITAFDTAHVYAWDSRSVDGVLGRWLQHSGHRSDVVIMAKGCHPEAPDWELSRVNASAVEADVASTLERMNTDYVDVWSFHRDDPSVPVADLVDAANREISAGRVRAWGVSNWHAARIQAAIDYAQANQLRPPVVNSAHDSMLDQIEPPWPDVVSLTGPAGAADREWQRESDVLLVAWSTLCGGMLSDNISRAAVEAAANGHLAEIATAYASTENWDRRARAETVASRLGCSLSDVAIAWVLGTDLGALAVVGGASPTEVRQNARAASIELSPDDHTFIRDR